MTKGRFAKRNAGTVNRRPDQDQHDAHVVAWMYSEERAYALGFIAVIGGKVVSKGGAA